VADYVAQFLTTAYDTGLMNQALVPYFRIGLLAPVLRQVLNNRTFTRTTVEEWITEVTLINDVFQVSKENIWGKGITRTSNTMDVDTVKKAQTFTKKVPDRDTCREKGLCWHCGAKYDLEHSCKKGREVKDKYHKQERRKENLLIH
jgi:hypothetical protein